LSFFFKLCWTIIVRRTSPVSDLCCADSNLHK
jgi:hypothetical protein